MGTDRQTDGQTDRQTDGQTDRRTDAGDDNNSSAEEAEGLKTHRCVKMVVMSSYLHNGNSYTGKAAFS